MKVYLVKYTLEVCEEIEANSKAEAEQTFSEMFSSAEDMCEMGTTTVEYLGKVE